MVITKRQMFVITFAMLFIILAVMSL